MAFCMRPTGKGQMRLTARWENGSDASVDMPTTITFEDGRRGTLDDLRAHNRDTYCLSHPDDRTTQMDIFPEIVASAYFCEFGGVWGLKGDGVQPVALGLTDVNATDQEILSAAFRLAMKYRIKIVR